MIWPCTSISQLLTLMIQARRRSTGNPVQHHHVYKPILSTYHLQYINNAQSPPKRDPP